MRRDTGRGYWGGYSNLQRVKHALIRDYLAGWFPKLGLWAGVVAYIDTHAGRGRHDTAEMGSPLVALRALLTHRSRDAILKRSRVRFVFIERDPESLRALREEIAALKEECGEEIAAMGSLFDRIDIQHSLGNSEELIANRTRELDALGLSAPPSFAFVDPWGFRVRYSVLRGFMSHSHVEIFVNVMWRHLSMAMTQARQRAGMAALLDRIFDGPEWRAVVSLADHSARAEEAVRLVQSKVGAQWATTARMLGANRAVKYMLIHLTNNQAGRDLMKETMSRLCSVHDGNFIVREGDDPAQLALLTMSPDLRGLEAWVIEVLRERPRRLKEVYALVRDTNWLQKDARGVIDDLRRRDIIEATDYTGRFSERADPLLSLKES